MKKISIKKYPSVTIIMVTFNDEKIIYECFKSIRKQEYPAKISIIIVDGGSTDKTVEIAKKFKVRSIVRPDLLNKPYLRGEIAAKLAETEIAISFSADNRFKEKDCLKKMMKPFFDKEISAVETFRYGFNNKSSLLTKYFALIGGADPIAVALGKADRSPYDSLSWHSFGEVEDKKDYFKVTFDDNVDKVPTLGVNGFAIRNSLLKKFPPKNSLHVEMCINLIKNGYNKFAFVKNAHIIHEINIDLISFCKRRLQWAFLYSSSSIKRKYFVFNFPSDLIKLILIILSTLTIVVPLIRAIRGFARYRNMAWFLHPFILLIFLATYGLQTVRNFTLNLFNAVNKRK